MRGKRFWAGVAAVAVVCGFGVAAAQQAAPAAPPPQIGVKKDVNLTPEQMQAQAGKYLPEMEQGASFVRKQLADARQANDVVKVLCLDDKLNQIDVAIRSARDRVPLLNAAVGQKDADQAKHEFSVIDTLRDQVRKLVAEANQCIGEETSFIGDQELTVDIDPGIPDDPSQFPDDPLISQPPVISSPTQ